MNEVIRVYYHADGGQCCTPTYRDFRYPDQEEQAREWYLSYLNEKGHTCTDHTILKVLSQEEAKL